MRGSRLTPFLVAASLLATPTIARAQALDDPTIVAIFDAANTWDVETGALAAERGRSQQVRDFGAMLARDHRAVRQQGRDLARKLGVQPTPPKDFAMARDHEAALERLRALRGAAFDQAFLAHEVAFHQAVLDAVRATLLPALRNPEVRELVTKVAPAFEAHRAAAANLQKQLAAN
jgi:putative membrane protein